MLEHRSYGYNWLQQTRMQNDKEKKDGFMSYIKQLSKDKITLFTQGGSKGVVIYFDIYIFLHHVIL